MFRNKKEKRWFGIMVAIIVCLAVVSVARADWQEQDKLIASDGAAYDWFGGSVSVSGDYCVVGAPGDDDDMGGNYVITLGSAYIFKRDGTTWTEQAKLSDLGADSNDWFGDSVSISGDYCVVGGRPLEGPNGSAYIFNRVGESWNP